MIRAVRVMGAASGIGRFFTFTVWAAGLALAGCAGTTVSVTDEAGFQSMARHFGPELRARNILDSDGAWLEPLITFGGLPDDAGERLFRRMSPAFRFRGPDPRDAGAGAPATFAASRAEGDELELRPLGFSLVQGMRRVSVSLLGLTDWNGDGQEDWLARCAVRAQERTPGEDERDYYLVITDPDAPIIMPRVIGVYDCRARRCTAYAGGLDCPPESTVVELLAGQRTVTAPPAQTGASRPPDALREQKLNN